MTEISKGKVYLIGAGPGDIELLTIKAVKTLSICDVLMLDDLVNDDILQFKKSDALVVRVGKRKGSKHTEQDEIISSMLSFAQRGLSVGRVKGGDPFIFGRGGEEVIALQVASIDCEVISGITAGIALPTIIGIPLTHRRYSSGVTFITGHSCYERDLNWQALVDSHTTVVVYMGISRAAEISQNLRKCGMSPETPCAIIENGSLLSQRAVVTKLCDLSDAVKFNELVSPAIIVIGEVVALANPIRKFCSQSKGLTKFWTNKIFPQLQENSLMYNPYSNGVSGTEWWRE